MSQALSLHEELQQSTAAERRTTVLQSRGPSSNWLILNARFYTGILSKKDCVSTCVHIHVQKKKKKKTAISPEDEVMNKRGNKEEW